MKGAEVLAIAIIAVIVLALAAKAKEPPVKPVPPPKPILPPEPVPPIPEPRPIATWRWHDEPAVGQVILNPRTGQIVRRIPV